jgi:hypothetical protein
MDQTIKARNVILALLGVAVLVAAAHVSGPGAQLCHAYAGNAGVSFALYFAALLVTLRWAHPRLAAALATVLVVTLFEVSDGFGVMANVYDPWDLAANAVGVALAIAADVLTAKRMRRPTRRTRPDR